ncbi:MAG: ester cyclase, partial [Candidatus Promineifilaceae bacterium]|nr:ester cyclase [Candidatus Promineifilaceae bacterium]
RVVTRFTFSGTHEGEFMGVPATGRQFSITAIAIARVTGGKLVEWWENADVMSLMQQLGALPTGESG